MDWIQKGRDAVAGADIYCLCFAEAQRRRAAEVLAWPAGSVDEFLRGRFADLLTAARWGYGLRIDEERVIRKHMDLVPAEREALRLLVEGFRERLKEIATTEADRGPDACPHGVPRNVPGTTCLRCYP